MEPQFGGTAGVGVAGGALVALAVAAPHAEVGGAGATTAFTLAGFVVVDRGTFDHPSAEVLVPEIDGLKCVVTDQHFVVWLE